GVVEVAVEVWALIGEPADGEAARRRAAAVSEPNFGLGGGIPGALGNNALEFPIPLDAAQAVAEIALGGLQAELNRRVGCVKRAERSQPFAELHTAAIPLPRFFEVA